MSLAARRRRPLLVDAPAAKAARNLERLARKLLAAITAPESASAPDLDASRRAPPAPTHYDTLQVDRGASDEEIRRAVRRMRELYAKDSLCASGLCSVDSLETGLSRVEEARDVLLDPIRRRPYDLSISPPDRRPGSGGIDAGPEPVEVEPPPMPERTRETAFPGAPWRAVPGVRAAGRAAFKVGPTGAATNIAALKGAD